jgi:hypothetical protein
VLKFLAFLAVYACVALICLALIQSGHWLAATLIVVALLSATRIGGSE